MIKYTLTVDGMKCGMCESHVNDCVRRAAPIKKVTSSHSKGITEIICEDNTDIQAIKNAIAAQGYYVTGEKSEPYVKRGLFHRG